MKQFIKECFTGQDNSTADIGRILWFMSGIILFFCTLYNIENFNAITFCGSVSTLLVGGAGALKLKQSTEPQ